MDLRAILLGVEPPRWPADHFDLINAAARDLSAIAQLLCCFLHVLNRLNYRIGHDRPLVLPSKIHGCESGLPCDRGET
jgi:hypothetical protein